jgi:drug/metabolite transporter (DMT)-like permease
METVRQRQIGIGMLVFVNLLWAGSFPAMAFAVSAMSPSLITVIRLGTGALVLAPFLLRERGIIREPGTLLLCIVLGAVGFAAPVTLEMEGLADSTPAMAAIAIAIEPLFTAIVATLALHERLSKRRIIAFLLALLGAWIIADMPRPGKPGYIIGDILLLLAVFCYALYNAYSSRLTARLSPSAGAGATLLTGFLTSIPIWLLAGKPIPAHMDTAQTSSLLYLCLGATAVAYLLWQVILNRFQVSFAALFLYLQPVFGVVLSVLIVGTHPPAYFYAGGALILFAIFIGQKTEKISMPQGAKEEVSL